MENNNPAKIRICTIKEVRYLFDPPIGKSCASSKIQLLRDALDKQKPKIITVDEFLNYYGLQS